jgi:hypothetical protein
LRLVVVDPVAKLLRLKDPDATQEVSPALESLEGLAKKYQLHVMILTHAKKRTNENDNFDSIMSSTAFRAGTDTNLVIYSKGGKRIIETEQRWGVKLEPRNSTGMPKL